MRRPARCAGCRDPLGEDAIRTPAGRCCPLCAAAADELVEILIWEIQEATAKVRAVIAEIERTEVLR